MTQSDSLSSETKAVFGNKTRGKILRTSLILFNASGFDSVSTAQIANAADVLDGTLWYHFKAKQDLAIAHLDLLEARIEQNLLHSNANEPTPLGGRMLKTFDALWDFRYLVRDPLPGLQSNLEFSKRLSNAYESVERIIKQRLIAASEEGLLTLEGADIDALATNCVLIGRYWLDYARIRNGPPGDSDENRQQAIQQILTVLKPHFSRKVLNFLSAKDTAEPN